MAKKRRTRTKHPGIKLLVVRHRSGRRSHVARWRDPDTERWEQQSLDDLGLKNDDARVEWAIKKYESVVARRRERSHGAPKKTETPLSVAIADYFKGARLRPRTERTYRAAIDAFEEWAEKHGPRLVEQVAPAHLAQFKTALVNAPRMAPAPGGTRGERQAGPKKRSPDSINALLRPVATFLNHVRPLGLTPLLTSDHVADCLKQLRTPKPRREFLKASAIRELLKASLRHDAATYKLTRAENKGENPAGSTPRYAPISQFVALELLSGMRFSEALALPWSCVDLDAQGEHGSAVGEIGLTPELVKTGNARTVDLAVSPGLRQLLMALKLRAGSGKLVFGGTSASLLEAARKRVVSEFGGPEFSWNTLRRTCGTFLTNAFGIFGAASAYRSAKQLGHSVAIAEKHYLGVLRGIPREARTLDDAMGIADIIKEVIDRASGGARTASTAAFG